MKVYLAGPMRGYENYNFDAFQGAARLLRRNGIEVVSPHEIDIKEDMVVVEYDEAGNFSSVELSDTFTVEAALRRDFRAITTVDAIVVLPGWENSAGAQAELFVARQIGLPVHELVPPSGDEGPSLRELTFDEPQLTVVEGEEKGNTVGVNPKDLVGDTKAPLHLVPPAALVAAAQAIQNGARKYGPYNWRDYPVQAHAYYAAALRHLTAWWDGEDLDPESGQSHLGHVIAGLAILVDSFSNATVIDDRPKPGPTAALLRGADAANRTDTVNP